MKKPYLILFLLLSFTSGSLSSQDLYRTISWETGRGLLSFEHAIYTNRNDLPHYHEVIPIDNPHLTVELANPRYKEMRFDQEAYPGIPDSIHLQTRVYYHRNQPLLSLTILPVVNKGPGTVALLTDFELQLKQRGGPALKSQQQIRYTNQSVLHAGHWVRVKISSSNVYQITYGELKEMGFDNPEDIRVFGNGGTQLSYYNQPSFPDDLIENAIYMEKGNDGEFNSGDYILFYGQGPVTWYHDELYDMFRHRIHRYASSVYYYLTTNAGRGKKIRTGEGINQEATHEVTTYLAFDYHEENRKNLLGSGREFYGEEFNASLEHEFGFYVDDLVREKPVRIAVNVVGRSKVPSTFTLALNGVDFGSIAPKTIFSYLNNESYYGREKEGVFNVPANSNNLELSIRFNKPDAKSLGYLDYIIINARRQLRFTPPQMHFRDDLHIGENETGRFSLQDADAGVTIWDVTDRYNISKVPVQPEGNALTFKAHTDTIREFVAFDGSSFSRIEGYEEVANQNLHQPEAIEYLIITHPKFLQEAERLATYHREEGGLQTRIVTPESIYHEFSSGKPDVAAIRNYIRMIYERGQVSGDALRYVLLFGDGSYDNRSQDASNPNYILTYQSKESLLGRSTYVTDDFFALLDEGEGESTGAVDIGIGRFPVQTLRQASQLVDKSIHYNDAENMGDWRNQLCFIADDHDGGNWDGDIHMNDANETAQIIEQNYPDFNIDKIFLDAYPQENTAVGERYPEAVKAINNRVQQGALIVNYTGHGGEYGLAHERVISIDQINSWKNEYLPLFVTATCEFSRFDAKGLTSAGELVLLNPDGGGVALLTTTRIVYASSNKALNQNFARVVFESTDTGDPKKLGDIFRETKVKTGGTANTRKFSLLGDPALTLIRPKYKVITDSINHISARLFKDTLRALNTVTVHGHVADSEGKLLTGYNGILNSSIFDKPAEIVTLGNERPDRTFRFESQSNTIYKGKASVSNGKFSFRFIIPKDINYNIGKGKISYYASNRETGACGYNKEIIIGGSSDVWISDSLGPSIELFMNDEHFVYGGITDENPSIYARIHDSTGINTSGISIGHDIVAVLDGTEKYNLNNYFEADLNSYKSGKLNYQLNGLEPGNHHIRLKVWDILNNSSEARLEFVVEESAELALNRLYNYPNPFTEQTSFYFEHNHPDAELEVLIQIFTISGKLVKTIETTIVSEGFRAGPVPEQGWDGLDDFGDRIGRGVYIYRLKARAGNGSVNEIYEKLVILK